MRIDKYADVRMNGNENCETGKLMLKRKWVVKVEPRRGDTL